MKPGFIRQKTKLWVGVFFVFYFLLGACIYRHYGISWDEPTSRDNGKIAYEYVTGQNKKLFTYGDRDYGTAFELPLYAAEMIAGITPSQQVYFLRHFLTFALFFASAVFFYRIASCRFGPGIGLAGVVFLVLSPRIFADSFYNSKDVALLSAMVIAVHTLLVFAKKPDVLRAVLHAAASAFIIDIRLPGLIIVPITMGVIILDTLLLHTRRAWRSRIILLFFYMFFASGFVVLFWPYLWSNPASNFVSAFVNFSRFLRLSDTVLYLGNYVQDRYVPWHYPLVWIGITTPLAHLGLFLAGIMVTAHELFRGFGAYYKKHREDVVFFLWFFGPLGSVIIFNSALYDGWRQLYFIYPGLVLIALVGLEGILGITKKRHAVRIACLVLITVNLAAVAHFMIRSHPYQNLYFNALAGGMEKAKTQFDLDYWGLTFRRGLEYIAVHDSSPSIPVFFAFGHKSNTDILADADKRRFSAVDKRQEAKYILVNYRWYKDRNNYRWDPYIFTTVHPEFHAISVDGVPVMTILKPDTSPDAHQ